MINKLEGFLEHKRLEETSITSINSYRVDLKQLIKFIEDNNLELNKESLIAYKDYMKDKYAINSTNKKIVVINMFMEYLDNGLKLKFLKVQKKMNLEDSYTYKEYLRAIKQANKKRDYRTLNFMKTIYKTGMRVSEALELTYEDLKKRKIKIINKNKQREIPLCKDLIKDLKEYCRTQEITSGPIFLTNTRKKVHRSTMWKKINEHTGMSRVKKTKGHPHSIRHLFAKEFLSAGNTIEELKNILGHDSIETTLIYVTGSLEEHSKSIAKMRK